MYDRFTKQFVLLLGMKQRDGGGGEGVLCSITSSFSCYKNMRGVTVERFRKNIVNILFACEVPPTPNVHAHISTFSSITSSENKNK